ncbi:MAG TPA: TonB family protein, partial [Kofleriaceae bacterium]|nr:TonB family protein [Kofleriaceae bacterium]
EAAHVDQGESAVDVQRHGPAADDRAVAASSDQRRPDPYDLTPPRAGGDHRGEGVAGVTAPGMVADGWREPGTAASRWGDSDEERATYATRSDPYFVELFRRLDQEVVFPRDLAIDLKSGRVVASVTVRADGALTAIALHAGSGYRGFDDALVQALHRIGPLGPVPGALIAGRRELRVLIPYTFKSSMIR